MARPTTAKRRRTAPPSKPVHHQHRGPRSPGRHGPPRTLESLADELEHEAYRLNALARAYMDAAKRLRGS